MESTSGHHTRAASESVTSQDAMHIYVKLSSVSYKLSLSSLMFECSSRNCGEGMYIN